MKAQGGMRHYIFIVLVLGLVKAWQWSSVRCGLLCELRHAGWFNNNACRDGVSEETKGQM